VEVLVGDQEKRVGQLVSDPGARARADDDIHDACQMLWAGICSERCLHPG
jgi:hypothetical protein